MRCDETQQLANSQLTTHNFKSRPNRLLGWQRVELRVPLGRVELRAYSSAARCDNSLHTSTSAQLQHPTELEREGHTLMRPSAFIGS